MDKEIFHEIVEKLKGLRYCFFSGFAVSLYIDKDEKREIGDLDIIISEKDIDKFADRIGGKIKRRIVKDSNPPIDDYGFCKEFKGIEVEATSGFPPKRMKDKSIYKLFDNRTEKEFFEKKIYVVPIEEVIVHKAKIFRDKDKKDLQMLSNKSFDKKLALELAEDLGAREKIIKNLESVGIELGN